ncbi:MAG: type IV pilus modification PilV family protein [bacterium]
MNNNKGFTIIEILITLVILSVGLLVIAELQITIIRGNDTARRMTEMITMVQEKLEELSSLPPDDPQLVDPDWPSADEGTDIHNNTDLFTNPDYGNDSPTPDFVRVYNVRFNYPNNGSRTVTVIVGWQDFDWHYHALSTIL